MKNKKSLNIPPTVAVDLEKWMIDMIPDTPEAQAIALEEAVKYRLVVALSKARKAAGYTQADLAKKMGVKQSLISRWENVNQNHTLETLLQLCHATEADLVMGLKIGSEFIPITAVAEDCVLNLDKHQTLNTVPARFASPYQQSPLAKNILKLPPTPYEIAPKTLKVIGG